MRLDLGRYRDNPQPFHRSPRQGFRAPVHILNIEIPRLGKFGCGSIGNLAGFWSGTNRNGVKASDLWISMEQFQIAETV
jgi:hypothetical protein